MLLLSKSNSFLPTYRDHEPIVLLHVAVHASHCTANPFLKENEASSSFTSLFCRILLMHGCFSGDEVINGKRLNASLEVSVGFDCRVKLVL